MSGLVEVGMGLWVVRGRNCCAEGFSAQINGIPRGQRTVLFGPATAMGAFQSLSYQRTKTGKISGRSGRPRSPGRAKSKRPLPAADEFRAMPGARTRRGLRDAHRQRELRSFRKRKPGWLARSLVASSWDAVTSERGANLAPRCIWSLFVPDRLSGTASPRVRNSIRSEGNPHRS